MGKALAVLMAYNGKYMSRFLYGLYTLLGLVNFKHRNMKKYTIEQYRQMAKKFNQMSFYDKIKTIRENKEILTLASDGNWWGVKVKDNDIQEELFDNEEQFNIENEWQSSEMMDLVSLLGIDNTDI